MGGRDNKNKIIKSKSQRLIAKHSFQYFLLRQKTPPAIIGTTAKIVSRVTVR
jgi:hypothetical protein